MLEFLSNDPMENFEVLRSLVGGSPSLRPLSASEIDAMRVELPGIPESYTRFLQEFGYGELEGICLYSGPVAFDSVYRAIESTSANVLLVGDDMQGYCIGFLPDANWTIVEFDPRGIPERECRSGFVAFMIERLA